MPSYTITHIDRNTNHISREVDAIVESTASILEQRGKDRILRRISAEPIDLDDTHRSALRVRKGSIGQWLTSSPEFQRFLGSGESNVFWLSGRRECL